MNVATTKYRRSHKCVAAPAKTMDGAWNILTAAEVLEQGLDLVGAQRRRSVDSKLTMDRNPLLLLFFIDVKRVRLGRSRPLA